MPRKDPLVRMCMYGVVVTLYVLYKYRVSYSVLRITVVHPFKDVA